MGRKLAAVLGAWALLIGLAGCAGKPTALFTEESVTINAGTQWALGATLTIPNDAKAPLPAVVLVQGSGPSDRDETVYANKPFKDIAEYLSSHGIAVLRYDKRTSTYGAEMAADLANITVETEMIQDTIAAADLVKADARIDKSKVFLLGHSEGGMMTPRIDAEGGDFAGLVILAGSPRNLSDILIDQTAAAVEKLSDAQKPAGQLQLAQLIDLFDRLPTMTDDEARATTIGGASAYYFKEMNEHPASGYLTNLKKPVLILQGDKDSQVNPVKDYGAYQTLLTGRDNVTFKLYPGLNHLFMTSITGTAADYQRPGHMDETVLKDITAWLQDQAIG